MEIIKEWQCIGIKYRLIKEGIVFQIQTFDDEPYKQKWRTQNSTISDTSTQALLEIFKNQSEALKVAIEAMEISHFLNNKENIRQFLRDEYNWACPENNENKASIAAYMTWALNEALQKIKELTGEE